MIMKDKTWFPIGLVLCENGVVQMQRLVECLNALGAKQDLVFLPCIVLGVVPLLDLLKANEVGLCLYSVFNKPITLPYKQTTNHNYL